MQNEPVAARTRWMPAIGNHEMEPWDGADGYGGMRARFTTPDNAWSQSTGIDFIVVYLHQCTYSTCHDNGAELGAQQDWAPLFDKYKVDLVLSGHNHVYERTDPIRAGKATRKVVSGDTVDPVKDGTTYVVAGGGGGGLYSFPASDTYLGHESANDKPVPMVVSDRSGHSQTVKVTWSRVRYAGYCLVAIDVTPAVAGKPARMELRSVTEDGTAVDRVTVQRG
ncbi:metallophosphoesterase [Kitasatospora sp. NPDC058444]|uniref:metallophosphoesterase n=1 Tax=Kitasatospora sp. NPDC058444 TaxID=3346504 RepID=UPI00365941BD